MGARGRQKADADSVGRLAPLVDAMMRPGFYPDSPARVELKQNHISYVFVADDSVYKIKKPVHFPFLDCSNLADRFRYCYEEMRLNARLSPGVYRGVFAILKRGDSFALGPKVDAELPEAVEYAVRCAGCPMDLDRLGAPILADKLIEDYAEITGDEELAVFVPFYKCYRAIVRGKVESLRSLEREISDAERERARQLASGYFALAWRYARGASPSLIVVCGLSGSGKSTVSRMLQHRKGFRAINSDRVRKRLASIPPHEHVRTDYGANLYSERFNQALV